MEILTRNSPSQPSPSRCYPYDAMNRILQPESLVALNEQDSPLDRENQALHHLALQLHSLWKIMKEKNLDKNHLFLDCLGFRDGCLD